MDYSAQEWENLWFFDTISEKSPFSEEVHAFRLGSMPNILGKEWRLNP